ncbi:hypothetical protein Leryth_013342 [Lithospermum erythrorhizon]|nr:hypothetical protein Leryth_013342 [Lithospermum erythrorhizon]
MSKPFGLISRKNGFLNGNGANGRRVVDCRVCGDPHSVLRFAFVEFTDEFLRGGGGCSRDSGDVPKEDMMGGL